MKRYTVTEKWYECRIKNCQMENYLRTFNIDTDFYIICEDCPFMEPINRLADLEDKACVYDFDPRYDHG